MSAPKLAIHCITYNHEPYIRECLEGFVMQQTDFPFIAIVHDDASTDGTAAIVREYADRYPDIIKPILETENKYSTGELGNIMLDAIKATGAEYVAYCEGDDYWTDPHKLQRQVDILDSHPEYSLCFHNAMVIYQNSNKADHLMSTECNEGEQNPAFLYRAWPVATASIILRSEVLKSDLYLNLIHNYTLSFGDQPLVWASAHFGRIHYIDSVMSVYRICTSGAGTYLKNNRYADIRSRITVAKYFGEPYTKLEKKIRSEEAMTLLTIKRNAHPLNRKAALLSIRFAPTECLTHWINSFFFHIKTIGRKN